MILVPELKTVFEFGSLWTAFICSLKACCYCSCLISVVFDSVQPNGLQPTRLPFHGILQERILEWVALTSSRGSSQHRDWTGVSCIAGRLFTTKPSRKSKLLLYIIYWSGGLSCLFLEFWQNTFHLYNHTELNLHNEPLRVGPPKTDRSWWRVLTKHASLEKGTANYFNVIALRTPWTVWNGKKIGNWKMNSLGL